MAQYHLYKNGFLYNIIEADEAFINELKAKGEIDDAIDRATIENPVSLKYNKEGHFVPNLPIPAPIMPEQPKQITSEEIMEKVEALTQKLEITEKQVVTQTQDVNAAILAIKGFMMEIPNIQKTLLQLQDMIKPK